MSGKAKEFHSKLPLRVTGIVFWGLVVIGLVITLSFLHFYEKQVRYNYNNNVSALIYEVEKILETSSHHHQSPGIDEELETKINALRKKMRFTRVDIRGEKIKKDFGVSHDSDNKIIKAMDIYNKHTGSFEKIYVDVYFPNQKMFINDVRKKLFMVMGLTLFILWLVFQRVLKNILTDPFLDMVQRIQSFSRGNENVRFDDTRPDEFGYLGKFINDALESVIQKQAEVKEALKRAKISEKALVVEKDRAEITLHTIADAVITVDVNAHIEYLNPAAEILIGVTSEEAKGRRCEDIISIVDENSGDPIDDPIKECFSTGDIIEIPEHSSIMSGNANMIAIEASIAPMKNDAGEIMGAVMIIQDVSHTRKLTSQLSHQASHDMLTGLYNRRKFEEQLQLLLENAQTEDREHSLCYIDLDQFKIVNDTCGHTAGDELLKQLPHIFHNILRSGDIVARLGGDEFGILLDNCNINQAADIANKVRQAIKDFRFVWDDKSFEIGASIGVVAINADSVDISEMMSSADIACYAAKDSGRNLIHVFEPSDEAMLGRYGEMHWTARITNAIDEDRFVLYQQSIISISGSYPGHIEILVRMLDADNNIIPPSAFMPAAERYNLMKSIDRWVIGKVFECIKEHRLDEQALGSGGLISINLSGESINDNTLLNDILYHRDKHNIDLECICFEITETVAISNLVQATHFIKTMKDHGCSFALDDFGSGLSSFAYLKSLPVNFLKIDGAFIKQITHDDIDKAMVSSIQQLGKIMNLRTVAECVENKATLDVLESIGIDYAQGYYLNKPSPIDT